MLRIFKSLLIAVLLGQGHALAGVSEVLVNGVGSGSTRDEAVASALANAAAQAFGVQIDATTISSAGAVEVTAEQSSSIVVNTLNTSVSTKVRASGNKPIIGYTVTAAVQGSAGLWDAEVTMRYAQFERIGPKTDRRSVIVVTPDNRYADMLVGSVEQALLESRRFDVLDRDNTKFYELEKLFVQGEDASVVEIARLGNASGADYLLIAELANLEIVNNQRETIRLTGEVLVSSSLSGTLKLQMVEFASRKVKWTGSQKFARHYDGISAITQQTLAKHASTAADSLIDKMFDAIYPIRVVKVVGGTAIINRGEGAVARGEKFRIFLVGEELIDPQSGESLGSMEVEAGTGVVSDVKPKFAYLKITGSQLDGSGNYLVRRAP